MSELYAFAHGNPEQGGDPGMTLRDYFAGQALPGYIAALGALEIHPSGFTEECAKEAYAYADAMLAARKSESS